MAQLPSPNNIAVTATTIIRFIRDLLKKIGQLAKIIYQKTWNWMRLHLPFVEALVQRHLANPSTVFVDIAIVILTIYIAFGADGAILAYRTKSESRYLEVISSLYPLPAAKVDGSFVWEHDFLKRLRFLNTFNKQAPSSVKSRPPTDAQLRKQVLDGLIENQVLILEAKKSGVSVSSGEVDAAYTAQQKQTPDFSAKINQLYGMSVSDFKEVLAEKILKQKVTAAVVAQIRVSHILTTSLDVAKQARAAIKAGMSFTDAAKKYSQDAQTKDSGGDLGYWTKGELTSQINKQFEDIAFKLSINQLSDPVQSQFGYHIITVTSKTGDNFQSYSDWYAQTQASDRISRYVKTQ